MAEVQPKDTVRATRVRALRARALRRLPRAYSLAVRLREAGVDDALIAECLEIEPEAVGPLLELAEAKIVSALVKEPREPPRAERA